MPDALQVEGTGAVGATESVPSDSAARRSARPRRAKAKRELEQVLAADRYLVRRATVAAIGLRLAPILLPLWLRWTLDPIKARRSVVWWERTWTPDELLLATILVGLFVALVRAAMAGWLVATAGRYGHGVVARLRVAMFEHILRVPVRYLDRRGCGRVMLRFIGDSDALRNWVSKTRPTAIADGVLLVALTGALAVVCWPLAAVVGAALPLVGVVLWMLRPELYGRTVAARRLQAEFTGHIERRLNAIRQMKWLDRFTAVRRTTHDLAERIAAQNARRDRRAALVEAAGQLLAFGMLPLLLAGGVHLLWADVLSLGQFIAVMWLLSHAMVALHRLSRTMIIREKAVVSVDRVLRLLERSAERGRGTHCPKPAITEPVLTARELVFTDAGIGSPNQPWTVHWRGPGIVVLPETIPADTFGDLLLGYQRPREGRLSVGGADTAACHVRSLRRAVGWITSPVLLVEGTIEDNIRIAAPHRPADFLLRQMTRYDLGIDDPQAWLARPVETDSSRLSPDDRLQIAFYRAVFSRPALLWIASLGHPSPTLRAALARAVEQIGRRRTLVMAAAPAAAALGLKTSARALEVA